MAVGAPRAEYLDDAYLAGEGRVVETALGTLEIGKRQFGQLDLARPARAFEAVGQACGRIAPRGPGLVPVRTGPEIAGEGAVGLKLGIEKEAA